MALTADDLLHDADLFRRCYPNWPLANPEPAPEEITIDPGDDTACSTCLCPLPAGAPAWPAADGFNCADCAPESTEGESR